MIAKLFTRFVSFLFFSRLFITAAAPANDDRSSPQLIPPDAASFSGSTFGATLDPIDPTPDSSYGSIWWSWTPAISGFAVIKLAVAPTLSFESFSYCLVQSPDGATIARMPLVPSLALQNGAFRGFPIVAGQTYLIELIRPNDTGANNFGLLTSTNPIILEQPQDQTIKPGGTALFKVLVEPRRYIRWQFNGQIVTNHFGEIANGPTLAVDNVSAQSAGSYRAIIGFPGVDEIFYSADATLTLTGPDLGTSIHVVPTTGSLTNLTLTIDGNTNEYHNLSRAVDSFNWFDGGLDATQFHSRVPANTPFQLDPNVFQYANVFVRARRLGDFRDACIQNLRRILWAKNVWTIRHAKESGSAIVDTELNEEIGGFSLDGQFSGSPRCPVGGVYTYNPVDSWPTCSIEGHALPITP